MHNAPLVCCTANLSRARHEQQNLRLHSFIPIQLHSTCKRHQLCRTDGWIDSQRNEENETQQKTIRCNNCVQIEQIPVYMIHSIGFGCVLLPSVCMQASRNRMTANNIPFASILLIHSDVQLWIICTPSSKLVDR